MVIQYKVPQTSLDVGSSENSEMDQISNALNSKSKQIDEEFKILRKKFLETAEQKMDSLKQKDDILEEIERIRMMYQDLKKENSNLKNKIELLSQRLESKNTLAEYLEEKCAKISTEKETDIIKLKSEILVLQKSMK
jgi:chromosome segregation ATPase